MKFRQCSPPWKNFLIATPGKSTITYRGKNPSKVHGFELNFCAISSLVLFFKFRLFVNTIGLYLASWPQKKNRSR